MTAKIVFTTPKGKEHANAFSALRDAMVRRRDTLLVLMECRLLKRAGDRDPSWHNKPCNRGFAILAESRFCVLS